MPGERTENNEEPGKGFEHEKVVGGANARIDWSLQDYGEKTWGILRFLAPW